MKHRVRIFFEHKDVALCLLGVVCCMLSHDLHNLHAYVDYKLGILKGGFHCIKTKH